MTVAMIKEAARLLDLFDDSRIVGLTEIGSEGAILSVGANLPSGPVPIRYLIARDGTSRPRP